MASRAPQKAAQAIGSLKMLPEVLCKFGSILSNVINLVINATSFLAAAACNGHLSGNNPYSSIIFMSFFEILAI